MLFYSIQFLFSRIDCVLYAVGKPVFHKSSDLQYGAWLKDPQPPSDEIGEKVWTTNSSDIYHIGEYANKVVYRSNSQPLPHTIGPPGFVVCYWISFVIRFKIDFNTKLE